MSITVSRYQISDYRLKKMVTANDEQEATRLRGWHGFLEVIGLNAFGVNKRREKLKQLYKELHQENDVKGKSWIGANPKSVTNIDHLITFIKIRNLVEDPAIKSQFTVSIEAGTMGAIATINYKIGSKSICVKQAHTLLEKSVISQFTDPQKLHQATEEEICQAQKLHQGTIVFQRIWKHYTDKQKQILEQSTNPKGFVEIKHAGKKIGFVQYNLERSSSSSKDLDSLKNTRKTNAIVGNPKPLEVINEKLSGGFKQLTHLDRNYVGLTAKRPLKALSQDYLNLIRDLHIIVPQYNVEDNFWVAKNLGSDLFELSRDKKKLNALHLLHFEPLLQHLKTFHEREMAHRDIKLENLFFDGEKVYLSDLDTMGKLGEFNDCIGTDTYTTKLFMLNPNTHGQIADNYAMLTSLIFIAMDKNNIPRWSFKEYAISWIKENVKKEYHYSSRMLLLNPDIYYNLFARNQPLVSLVDMIDWHQAKAA
ncbi:MAG: hypothetical protein ACK4M7_01810 [Burkholderiales bacterium]